MLDRLVKVINRKQGLIMMKYFHLFLELTIYTWLLIWFHKSNGQFMKWMSSRHFKMEIWKKKIMQINHLVISSKVMNINLKLTKDLYGIKQATSAWYTHIDSYIPKHGFFKCPYGHTLYVKSDMHGTMFVVCFSVDDLIFTRNNSCRCF